MIILDSTFKRASKNQETLEIVTNDTPSKPKYYKASQFCYIVLMYNRWVAITFGRTNVKQPFSTLKASIIGTLAYLEKFASFGTNGSAIDTVIDLEICKEINAGIEWDIYKGTYTVLTTAFVQSR